jgi:hypothetical protein
MIFKSVCMKAHADIAASLVRQLKQTRKEKMEAAALDRRKDNLLVGFKGLTEVNDDSDNGGDYAGASSDAQAELRKSMIRSLFEAPKGRSDAPPSRLPTKEERDLLKMSLDMEKYSVASRGAASLVSVSQEMVSLPPVNMSNSVGSPLTSGLALEDSIFSSDSFATGHASVITESKGGLLATSRVGTAQGRSRVSSAKPQSSEVTSRSIASASLTGRKPAGTKGALSRTGKMREQIEKRQKLQASMSSILSKGDDAGGADSSMLLATLTGGPSLWTVPGQKDIFGEAMSEHDIVNPAFSDSSLRQMMREGLIDADGLHMLRKIGKDSEAVTVYERSISTLVLRSPSLSTTVTLPALGTTQLTEVKFGAQKVSYMYNIETSEGT